MDLEKLKRKIKAYKIVTNVSAIMLLPSIFLIGTYFNKTIGFFGFIMLITLIINLMIFPKKINEIENIINNINTSINKDKQTKYKLKTQTITNNEMYFLNIINKHFSNQYLIKDQVPLSSIIEKEKSFKNEYQNELNRIIDIGIFDKQTTAPLLLIEINDSTHEQYNRKQRDIKVKNICEQAGIKLITFWTNKENKEDYVINRIRINLE